MLYDNALLARAYVHGWQVSGAERWRRVATRRSTGRCARCAAPRAASTRPRRGLGGRGGAAVWSEEGARDALDGSGLGYDEIERVLGYRGVSAAGNFEGRNVLHVPLGAAPRRRRRSSTTPAVALLAAREQRVRPASTTSSSPPGTR